MTTNFYFCKYCGRTEIISVELDFENSRQGFQINFAPGRIKVTAPSGGNRNLESYSGKRCVKCNNFITDDWLAQTHKEEHFPMHYISLTQCVCVIPYALLVQFIFEEYYEMEVHDLLILPIDKNLWNVSEYGGKTEVEQILV